MSLTAKANWLFKINTYERPKTCMENKSSVNERPFCSKRQVIKFGYRRLRARSIKGHGSTFFMPLIFVNQGLFSNRSWDCHGSGSLAGVLGHFLGAI